MSQTTDDLRQQLNKSLDELKHLRDEIRVKLHLASMDAKSRWEKLEPRFTEAEQHVRDAGERARHAVADVIKAFKSFSSSLGEKAGTKQGDGQPEK